MNAQVRTRWHGWLMLLPPIMVVVLPLVGGATAWVTARVDAANAAQEMQIRKDYLERQSYESDRRAQEYLRDQLDKRLERMESKIDMLLERKTK